jgi:sugar transferase (PEP-CTERM system associated)
VPHIRVLRHYIHTPFLLLALAEAVIIVFSAYLGYFTRHGEFPLFWGYVPPALTLAVILVVAMVAMGVYESRIREGMSGMLLRSAVALFLLGTAGMALLSYIFPFVDVGRGVLLFATVEAYALITLLRISVFSLAKENTFKKQIVVIGIGQRALKIATRMRRRIDKRAFVLRGFLDPGLCEDRVSDYGVDIIRTDQPLVDFCQDYAIDEIVVAMDERRRNDAGSGGLPLDELVECRLSGIQVCDVQQFIEREACKVDVDLLRPSWLVFSDGFIMSPWRAGSKRIFDLLAALLLLLIAWPVMLITALLIRLQAPEQPVLYRQHRMGLNGQLIDVLKFRSMDMSAESGGASWAQYDDPRVTRIGRFIRKTRIDEFPQILNVLRGDMSFVGPRPERPVFVEELKQEIPFYDQRHRVKPGITGWAQLCYPYGASAEDAKEKLQYDLYYLKNHSILLDLIILLQTVEVVLVGEGAR